jgi:cathepsin B
MSSEEPRSSSTRRRNPREESEENRKTTEAQERARQALKKKKKTTFWDKYSYHIVFGGLGFIIVASLLSTMFGKTKKLHLTPVIEEDEIETHNSEGYGYKLGPNPFFDGWNLADAKKIFNNHFSYKQSLMKCTTLDEGTILESSFDFREKYPDCVSPVMDQKNCSSSYAVASASAVSDRLCLLTKQNVRLSPQHYLSCQDDAAGNECAGGSIASFLDFAKKKGVVDENCFSYQGESNVACPSTIEQCQKYFVSDYCVANGVEGIKREILKNGPVIGYVPVYRDFLVYKTGVYKIMEGTSRFQGGHALKVIGWGTHETEGDYWIVENSWGEGWGLKGYGHIAIGQSGLYLDDYGFAANPKYEKEEVLEAPTKATEDVVNI